MCDKQRRLLQREYQFRLRSPREDVMPGDDDGSTTTTTVEDEQEMQDDDDEDDYEREDRAVARQLSPLPTTDVFRHHRHLRHILEFLTDRAWVSGCSEAGAALETAYSIMSIAECFGYHDSLLQSIAAKEANVTPSTAMVLRSDSVRVRVFVGVAHSGDCLEAWLRTVSKSSLSYIKKSSSSSNDSLTPEQYYTAVHLLLQNVASHIDSLPVKTLVVLRVLYWAFTNRFDGETMPAERAVHSILFLRLICPMLQKIPASGRRRRKASSSSSTDIMIPLGVTKLSKCLLVLVNRLSDINTTVCAELRVEPEERLEALQSTLSKIAANLIALINNDDTDAIFVSATSSSSSPQRSNSREGYDSDYDMSPRRSSTPTHNTLKRSVLMKRSSTSALVTRRSMSDGTVKAFCSSKLAEECREFSYRCETVGTYLLEHVEEFRAHGSGASEEILQCVRTRRVALSDPRFEERIPSFYGDEQCRDLYGYDLESLSRSESGSGSTPLSSPGTISSESSTSPLTSPSACWTVTLNVPCDEAIRKKLFRKGSGISGGVEWNGEIVVSVVPSLSCRNELLTRLDEELTRWKLTKKPFRLYNGDGEIMDCAPDTAIQFEERFRGCRTTGSPSSSYRMNICFCLQCYR